jgi:hypothetical protein
MTTGSAIARPPVVKRAEGVTPAEAARFIKFVLSDLGSANEQHEFEHLCRHLARRRIYTNILPATGPVSAGGDQGLDFETYPVLEAPTTSPFFAQAADHKVGFACSLQRNVKKKIKDDLRTILEKTEVRHVYFFTNQQVAVGQRHKIETDARETRGITLTIIDAAAIAEWLSDSDLFWLAQRYLSLPAELTLRQATSAPDWYRNALTLEVRADRLTHSDFFVIKAAARYAAFEEDCKSDLPSLISKLRLFQSHWSSDIQRRSIYEEFVLALRGLAHVEGYEDLVRSYLQHVEELEAIGQLEDAAVFLNYVYGAYIRRLLQLEFSEIVSWRDALLRKLERETDATPSAARRCWLLSLRALLVSHPWRNINVPISGTDFEKELQASVKEAIPVWKRMIKEARDVPMFPLESFSNILNQVVAPLGRSSQLSRLIADTDSLLARRFGEQKIAENAQKRAIALYEAGKPLGAIDELHQARLAFTSAETARAALRCGLMLSRLYESLGLHVASKLYAVTSAFAAINLKDDEARSYAPLALSSAVAADHANGATVTLFATAASYYLLQREFGRKADESESAENLVDFYVMLVAHFSARVDVDLYRKYITELLPTGGLSKVFDQLQATMAQNYGSTLQDLGQHARKAGICHPFSDVGPTRVIGWKQFGIEWRISWPADPDMTAAGEWFAATLQVLLADLRGEELSLVATEAHLAIAATQSTPDVMQVPDNNQLKLQVDLGSGWKGDERPDARLLTLCVMVLQYVSALDYADLKRIVEASFRRGLVGKLLSFGPYPSAFDSVYSKTLLEELFRVANSLSSPMEVVSAATDERLSPESALHPKYNLKEDETVIRRRYALADSQLKFTIKRIKQNEPLLAAIHALLNEGWKEWHVVLALLNIRWNFVAQMKFGNPTPEQMYSMKDTVVKGQESETDTPIPAELLTGERLREALEMSHLSTLSNWGFHPRQMTPNRAGVQRLLRRFKYWNSDVPHTPLFTQSHSTNPPL